MRREKKSKLRAAFFAALARFHKQALLTLFFGVVFLYGWLVYAATHPKLPSSASPLIFYSNQCRDDLKLTFIRALAKAKSSIFLIIYGLTDPDLLSLLEQKARSGLKVTIFYDPTGSSPLENKNTELFQAHPIISDGLMHKKILVIDHCQIFLGSANMTSQSLKMHDNFVVGLQHEGLADYIEHSLESQFCFQVNNQPAELWQLPEIDGKALHRILDLIETAQESISIAMFTFTHPEITEALIQAHERGIQVQVAIDYYSGRGASKKTLLTLQKAGIPTFLSRGGKLLHHKWCLIDQKIFVFGSANWTKAAFVKNDDCLLILENLHKDQKKFIHTLWKTLEI